MMCKPAIILDRYGAPARRGPPRLLLRSRRIIDPRSMPIPGITPQVTPGEVAAGPTYDTLSLVGNGTPSTTSVTLPTHTTGDVILIVAMRTADGTTVISTPASWNAHSSDNVTNRRISLFWRTAPSAGTTATGFTNAERCVAWVFRGADQSDPIGDYAYLIDGDSTSFDFAALTLERTNSTSWVCLAGGTRATTTSTTIDTGTVTGTARQGGGAIGSNGAYGYWDSAAPVSSWSSRSYTDTGNTAGQMTLNFEVRAATL